VPFAPPDSTRNFRAEVVLAMPAVGAALTISQAWVTAAPTTMSLTVTSAGSEVTSVAAGTVVTLTATVIPGATSVHPGQVKFWVATAKYCEDSALLATTQLTTAGDSNFTTATSNSVAQVVRPFAARPIFSPPAGSYTTPQTVAIGDISTKTIY